MLDNDVALTAFPTGTADDTTKFLWSHIKPMGVGLMENIMDNIYTPYITPAYVGTYTASSISPIQYRKPVGSKTVTIKGVTDNSLGMSMAIDDVVFVLPMNYRPNTERIFVSNNYTDIFFIRVKANGEVSIAGDMAIVSNVGCVMNICFDVD